MNGRTAKMVRKAVIPNKRIRRKAKRAYTVGMSHVDKRNMRSMMERELSKPQPA